MDFDALMQKKLGGKYLKPGRGEPEDSAKDVTPAKKPTQEKKRATLKPRVECSLCDFVGVVGKEMEMHRNKHEKTFDCTECTFVAKYKVVLRRHQQSKHNKKCQSCDFSAATSASLKMHSQAEHGGGLLRNSAGFMITNEAANDDSIEVIYEEPNVEIPRKKMTKCEYLKRQKEVKVDSKSKKTILRSFKDSFMTLKKKIANLHKQHGTEAEYLIIVKNNLQVPGGKTASKTAGQYMVYAEGTLLSELISKGIIFDSRFVLMANEYNMETKEVNLERDEDDMVEGR